MELSEAIKNRRSIRKWKDKDIPKQMIEKLIEAIIWAPSAGNLQARKFYFVYKDEIRIKLAEFARQSFLQEAPLVVVACADREKSAWKYGERGRDLYCVIDASLSIQNLMLQAHDLGLSSVPVGAFNELEVSELLKMSDNLYPFLFIPIGFPAESPEAPMRVSYTEAVEELR